MQEGLRRQYLKALGIPCLVPRFVLPGAAPSRRCEVPAVETANRVSVVPASPVEPVASPSIERPRLDVPDIKPVQPPQVDKTPPPPVAKSPAFSLTLCRSGSWLSVDEGGMPRRAYLRLVTNLLRACGDQSEISGELFEWPPARHPRLDTSLAAAGQVLGSRLQALHERQPLQRLLLLGRRPTELLQEQSALPDLMIFSTDVSLWQALNDASAKRQLWLELAAARWL